MTERNILDAAFNGGVCKNFGTPEWVVEMLTKLGGAATFRDIYRTSRAAAKDRQSAERAIRQAVDDGLVEVLPPKVGVRGRPRYEFRLTNAS